MKHSAVPIKEKNRLAWIDAARGFAILGIFIVNVGGFSAPYFLYGGAEEAWPSGVNQFVQVIIDIFFQASFYTLFSMLFGFGFQLMKDSVVQKGLRLYPFLTRRMFILIGFGIVHAFFIWYGDILLSYGVIGLFLLFFVKVKDKTLLMWGFGLLGACTVLITLALYAGRDLLDVTQETSINQAMESYQSNNLSIIWSQNYTDWMYSNGAGFLLMFFVLLPLFLFGMYIARKRWLHEPKRHHSLLQSLWMISLVLFTVFKIGPYLYGNPSWFMFMQDHIGGTASAIFYIISSTLLAQTYVGKKLINHLSYVGRMSLTNYIMQSVICVILFYGIGFGLYGSVSPSLGVMIALLVFGGQIFFSKWWVTNYRFGPFEWVWRSLTYMKRQPFRKKQADC